MSEMMTWHRKVTLQDGYIDGMDSLGDEAFIIGGFMTLNDNGLSCRHEDQVELGLKLADKFLVGDDVEGT
jgi:hypothetical protein